MAHQGATLQGFNNELVKCIEDLCSRREDLHRQILEEEEEKKKLSNDVRLLTERLARVNDSLCKKVAARNEFDRTITETEAAYMKDAYDFGLCEQILESSQTLLTVLKKESQSLSTKVSQTTARNGTGGRPS